MKTNKEKLADKFVNIMENDQSEYEDLIFKLCRKALILCYTEAQIKEAISNYKELKKLKA